jgi:DNA-binding HxlR family transcriptional regulator
MSRSPRARGSSDPQRSRLPETSLPEPLHELVDLLGRRHVLAVVWELRGPAQPFRVLAQRLAAPEAQVSQRLRELRESGLIEVDEGGDYRLTGEGRRLLDQLEGLAEYAESWAALSPRQRRPRGAAVTGRGEPPFS